MKSMVKYSALKPCYEWHFQDGLPHVIHQIQQIQTLVIISILQTE